MLKVLHVHSGNLFGGVERVLLTLQGVKPGDSGIHHEFALCFEGELSRRLGTRSAPVHMIGEVQVRNPMAVIRARGELRRLVERSDFDVVMTHSCWAQALFGDVAPRARRTGAFYLHDVIDGKDWLQRLARRNRPAVAVTNSKFTGRGLAALYEQIQFTVIYCPVDEPKPASRIPREKIRELHQTDDDQVVIAQIGRLEPFKGQEVLIEALGALRDVPGWTCWQVGDAQRPFEREYLARLKALARSLKIEDRVRFISDVPDIGSIYTAADIYCQPNTGPEGLGLTLVEALEAGLPVITSNIGGGVEVVEGCGWLVNVGDVGEVSGVLRMLVADAELRGSFVAAGRDRAHEMTDPLLQSLKLAATLAAGVASQAAID